MKVVRIKGKVICPNCNEKMSQLHKGNQRIIMGELITLPGELLGYKCYKCKRRIHLCPSCGSKNTKEHLPSVYQMFEEKNGYGMCYNCNRSFGFDDNTNPIPRPWQIKSLTINE